MSADDFEALRIERKPLTPEDLPSIQREFRRRQWRRMVGLAPIVIFVAIGLHAPQWLIIATVVITGAAAIYANVQFRCPACNALFGKRGLAGSKCPSCGVQLEA